jgi:hypothetical protein
LDETKMSFRHFEERANRAAVINVPLGMLHALSKHSAKKLIRSAVVQISISQLQEKIEVGQ